MLIEYLISILELTSLTIFAMMLHSLRRVLGQIPLYLAIGCFFVLGQVVLLPGFTTYFQDPSRVGSLVYGISLLPVLLLFLIVYESEGSQEAQRIVLGLVVLTLISFYITQLFISQYNLAGGEHADALGLSAYINLKMQRQLLVMTILHLFLYLLLPTFYQALRNYNLPIVLCFFLPIVFFLTASDQFLQYFQTNPVNRPRLVLLGRLVAMFWACCLANIYLLLGKMLRLERRVPLGFITSLFDHIKSASQMRQSVLEWAGRYETVLENSGELIFLLNEQGDVVNANTTAVEILGRLLSKPGFNLAKLITDAEEQTLDWEKAWQKLISGDANKRINTYVDMQLHLPNSRMLHIDFNLSRAKVNENVMALLIAHDTTVQYERQLEKQQLEEQLVHSQRMEAIGLLAGGVAHDFNNLLHTIQANTEMLSRQSMPIPAQAMLSSIDDASKRATELTSQLLGFARKGKFTEEILDLGTIIQQSVKFFQTSSRSIITKTIIEPTSLLVKGDAVQLQQIILNLLLNAKDALVDKDSDKNITIRVETARADMPEWKICPMRSQNATDFVFITVRDNGSGMPPHVRERIFEPFFTTKATGKGTGMGLAMVYGCVNNHRGWINVQSVLEEGTTFVVILPKAGEMPKL